MSESNGRGPAYDEHISTLYEDVARVATLLECDTATLTSDAIKEMRASCERIIMELPFTPWVEPDAFKVDPVDLTDWLITCPHCDNGFLLHGPTWINGGTREEGSRSTRVCPYCGEESLVIDKRPQWQRSKDNQK